MTWRRCSEEMPKNRADVLVWVERTRHMSGYPEIGLFLYGSWWINGEEWQADAVQYWQPITPPNEGTPHGNSDERTA